MEAIIPTKIGMPTIRTKVPKMANAEAIPKDLDMADDLREAAVICIASYQQRMSNLCNRHIKPHAFRVGNLILRKVFENTANLTAKKFQPNWEGPYVIVRVEPVGSYALNKLDGAPVPKMWNAMNLKCIISKVFFKGVKISFKVFSSNLWNITSQVFFKGIISFNNLHFKRQDLLF